MRPRKYPYLALITLILAFAGIGEIYAITATGGTITTSGNYTIHTFTSSGTFNVTGSGNVEYLIVAGGGGGGGGYALGGGGGAGGLLYTSTFAVTAQNYTVTVGGGGAGGVSTTGTTGQDSIFSSITAKGGGGGGLYNGQAAKNGGSGGGAGYGGAIGTGTAGQGYNGGTASTSVPNYGGGGGGGAGGVGANGAPTAGGKGGDGLNYTINGSNAYYSGGGGGSTYNGGTPGAGGLGGGGAGSTGDGTNGMANTGGGGGGGERLGTRGGNGGSGVVIIRYLSAIPPSVSLNSPANNAAMVPSSLTLNWTPSNFASNSTCNVTRNGIAIFSGICTNDQPCTTTNVTSIGNYSWNVTCYNADETKTSETRNFTVANPSVVSATGGSVTYDGNYTIHTFTSSGNFTVNSGGYVKYLVVAGGGGGGAADLGGGGGAGGLLQNFDYDYLVTSQTYAIVVGGGGSGGASGYGHRGIAGNISTFATITATGGGGGSSYEDGNIGGNGGSGGGASYGSGTVGTGINGQGHDGGLGTASLYYGCGGGGGAGGVGGAGTTTNGGSGGVGLTSFITGSEVYYAGGGGGSIYSTEGTGGAGGSGGGGAGSIGNGGSATANTGGGGGGSERGGTGAGGNGGSGVVIIRYLSAIPPSVSLNSPANNAAMVPSSLTLNWTPSNFASNSTCNVTRNGIAIFSGICTNDQPCTTTNVTSIGNYSWNVTCYNADETKTSETRNFTVNAPARISFIPPTPDNGISTPNTSVQINASIPEPSLSSFKFNWNGTNYTYYDDSLVLAMNFDNNSAIGENSAKAADISKYGNNGTINGASYIPSGKFGSALQFDGSGYYVSLPATGDYNSKGNLGFSSAEPFTLELWYKGNESRSYILGTGLISWTTGTMYAGFSLNGSKVTYYHYSGGWKSLISATSVNDNAWHHIVFVNNNSVGYIYIDGVLDASGSSTIDAGSYFQPKYIGLSYGSAYTAGLIDEVRIWSRSLSTAEIAQHYSSNIMKFNSSQWYFQSNQDNLSNGNYSYYAWANNTAGMAKQSETRALIMGAPALDASPPNAVLSSPSSGNRTPTASVTFACNALDNIALSSITLVIWNASGSQIYSNSTLLSGTSNSSSWDYTFSQKGNFTWNCLATDNSSNSAYATSNATLTIQKYARLDTIYPPNGAGISRGKDGPEDWLFVVPDNMTVLARISDNESGQPISGVQCGLWMDGAAKWGSISNSSGYCIFSYNKSDDPFGTHNISINQSNLPNDYVALSNWSNTTFKLENWSIDIDVSNYRVGTFYYAGDLVFVTLSVTKDGLPANASSLWLDMANKFEQHLFETSTFTHPSTGIYQTEILVPVGTALLHWEATASSNFSGQASVATSSLHGDMTVNPAPVAQLNFTMTSSSGQPMANSNVIVYRKGELGRYALLNQTMNSSTASLQQAIIQNDSGYDLEISTPDSSTISIINFNLSVGLNFATQQANFSDAKPNQTRLMGTVLASNATGFSISTLTFVKTFEPTSICSCQNWSFANSNCSGAWVCNSTSAYSYSSNSTHFWFNVTHFTGYALGQSENENLTIWDETDSGMQYGNQMRYINQNIRFFANYSNSTSEPIIGANCSIWFLDSGWNAMNWNSTNLYEYTKNFSSGGTFNWNVTCNKSGQTTLVANDTVLVNSTTVIILNSPADALIQRSSLVIFNWTPYGFPGDPSCNITRNGSVIHISSCTNNELCAYSNTTANGYYIWNITCNSGATTRESNTRTLTVNTIYRSSSAEGILNMNITEISSISLPQNTISFGTVEITQTYDSYPEQFFVIKNDGNTIVDVEVNATNPFLSSGCSSLPCSAYQVKVGANETAPYPSCPANPSQETYTNMFGSSSGLLINNFNFVDNDDSANIYIKYVVPNDEPPGSKSSTVTFWAKSANSYACD